MVQMLLYSIVGAIILTLNVWWVSNLSSVYNFSKPVKLGDITVIGQLSSPVNGEDLPPVILARINELNEQNSRAIEMLGQNRSFDNHSLKPIGIPSLKLEEIPTQFETVNTNIELNVGGVDFGPILGMILKQKEEPKIDVTISNESDSYFVYGHYPGKNSFTFKVKSNDGSISQITDTIASAILKEIASGSSNDSEIISYLNHEEYRSLMSTLVDFANYKQSQVLGESSNESLNEKIEKIYNLSDKFNKWSTLQWFAVELADEKGKLREAKKHLGYIVQHTKNTNEKQKAVNLILEIDKNIGEKNSSYDVTDTNPTHQSFSATQQLNFDNDIINKSYKILFVGKNPNPGTQKIKLEDLVLNATQKEDTFASFTFSVLKPLSIHIPKTEVTFIEFENSPMTDQIITNIRNLEDLSDYDILLYTYGMSHPGMTKDDIEHYTAPLNEFFVQISKELFVVTAAGNHGFEPTMHGAVGDRIFNIAATDKFGDRADYSAFDQKAFWAPGYYESSSDSITGTSSSAANFVVALLALLDKTGISDSDVIRDAISNSARPLVDGGPKIVDVKKAASIIKGQEQ